MAIGCEFAGCVWMDDRDIYGTGNLQKVMEFIRFAHTIVILDNKNETDALKVACRLFNHFVSFVT